MKLILVRHGETIWNQEKKIQGSTDTALSEAGRAQAERLSLSLKNETFDAIVTSPLKRAYDTAQAIARYHDITPRVEKDLRELNAGAFEGLSFPEIKIRFPDFIDQWMLDRGSVVMPQGESLQGLQNRVWPVIQKIMATAQNALVVSHSFVIITILCKIQNLSLSQSSHLRLGVASKTCLEVNNGATTFLALNDTSHLNDT